MRALDDDVCEGFKERELLGYKQFADQDQADISK